MNSEAQKRYIGASKRKSVSRLLLRSTRLRILRKTKYSLFSVDVCRSAVVLSNQKFYEYVEKCISIKTKERKNGTFVRRYANSHLILLIVDIY